MPHSNKIVLHCPLGYEPRVEDLVVEFMRDGVKFVGVVGQNCEEVESIIDELTIGNGTREPYLMLTSSHPDESVAEAITFAEALTGEYAGEVELIQL